MLATARYFQTLRESQGISRARLAVQLGISEMSLYRIEEQQQEPKAELLMALVRELKGNVEHVYKLLTEETATEDEARQLAMRWLSQEPSDEDRRRAALINVANDLLDDPQKLDRLLGYADRLREEGR